MLNSRMWYSGNMTSLAQTATGSFAPCWWFGGVIVLVFVLVSLLPSARCDLCRVPLRRTRYLWRIEGKTHRVCPNCNRRLEARLSKRALQRHGLW